MKTQHFPLILLLGAILPLGAQPAAAPAIPPAQRYLTALKMIKANNDLLLKKQADLSKRIDEAKTSVDQIRVLVKRG